MKNKKFVYMCVAAIFAALTFVFTSFVRIPAPTSNGGYYHIGDGFIFIAACILPKPYAVFAGVAGATLSDVLSGSPIWAIASAIIKALTVLLFSRSKDKIICTRNIAVLPVASLLCVGGYYIFEIFLTMSFIAPAVSVFGNLIQSVLSSILFVVAGLALDKTKLTHRLIK